jgi:hypothetical protein
MARGEEGVFETINYRRLLMGGRFPDDSFALISLVERTFDVEIEGLPEARRLSMPADQAMDGSIGHMK